MRRRVDREAALAHERAGLIVDAAAFDEAAVGRQQDVGGGERVGLVGEGGPVLGDQSYRGVPREHVVGVHPSAFLAELDEDSMPRV